MTSSPDATEHDRHAFLRVSAITLGLAAVSSVVFMIMHPTTEAHTMSEAMAEIGREAGVTKLVHGILVALSAAMVFGLVGLTRYIGVNRPLPIAALIAYATGFLANAGAAVINGFAVPGLQVRAAGLSAVELETLRQIFAFAGALNQALAQVGVVAISGAILLWSLALIRRTGSWRWIAAVGLMVGTLPAMGVILGEIKLDVLGFGAAVTLHATWKLLVAVKLGCDTWLST